MSKGRESPTPSRALSRRDRALAHDTGFHYLDVDLCLIVLRFEEDDAGVAGIVEIVQDETNLILTLISRRSHAADIAAEGSGGIPILGIVLTTATATVAKNERLGMGVATACRAEVGCRPVSSPRISPRDGALIDDSSAMQCLQHCRS
jgi:hypothetical protein